MACNCKTNRDLKYLQQNYGKEKETSASERVGFSVLEFFARFITFILTLVSLPFLIVFLLVSNRKNGSVNIGKLIRLKKAA